MISTPKERPKTRPPRTLRKTVALPDDTQSTASSKPSSVDLPGDPHTLTRELSDLSGSYYGNRSLRSCEGSEVSVAPRPWRQSRLLSSSGGTTATAAGASQPRAPQPPLPPRAEDQDSVQHPGRRRQPRRIQVVDSSDVVELVTKSAIFGDPFIEDHHHRIPLVILLMDPSKKQYELMQIWIDVAVDTVRDVLQTIQQNLNGWKQDYDGLFQIRNNRFNQIINVLPVSKYDVRPQEVWLAKPWGMPTRNAMNFAASLLKYLRDIEMVANSVPDRKSPGRSVTVKVEDEVLLLSQTAQERMFLPQGILKHHHALQFLCFSPPFEKSVRVDVLAGGSVASEEDSLFAESLSSSKCLTSSVDSGKPPLPPRTIHSVDLSSNRTPQDPTKQIETDGNRSTDRNKISFQLPDPDLSFRTTRLNSISSDSTDKHNNLRQKTTSSDPNCCFSSIFSTINCNRRRQQRDREPTEEVLNAAEEPTWCAAWEDSSFTEDRSVITSSSNQPLLVGARGDQKDRLHFEPILL